MGRLSSRLVVVRACCAGRLHQPCCNLSKQTSAMVGIKLALSYTSGLPRFLRAPPCTSRSPFSSTATLSPSPTAYSLLEGRRDATTHAVKNQTGRDGGGYPGRCPGDKRRRKKRSERCVTQTERGENPLARRSRVPTRNGYTL